MLKVWMLGLDEVRTANALTKRKVINLAKPLSIRTWKKWLCSGHSTLRFASVYVLDDNCPYTVACQIIRGTKEHTQGVMSSGRPDVTGKERDYTENRWLFEKYTPSGFLAMMRDRLCTRAEHRTQQWAENIRCELSISENSYLRALGEMCGPSCLTLNNCPESNMCYDHWRRV
jgi:hypothetical protein